jgi:hypothetical protein
LRGRNGCSRGSILQEIFGERSGGRLDAEDSLLTNSAQGLTVVAMLMGAYYLTEKAEDARPPHLDGKSTLVG